jgi:hypothetical protein
MKSLAIAFALFLIPVIVLLVVQTVSHQPGRWGLHTRGTITECSFWKSRSSTSWGARPSGSSPARNKTRPLERAAYFTVWLTRQLCRLLYGVRCSIGCQNGL